MLLGETLVFSPEPRPTQAESAKSLALSGASRSSASSTDLGRGDKRPVRLQHNFDPNYLTFSKKFARSRGRLQ